MILNKYKINLTKTKFPMRGNLIIKEPKFIKNWEKRRIYSKFRELFKNRPKFILHDGPPYANGEIHIGHAMNKILKDIIIKNKNIMGFDAHYIPGWDCHGMPIEIEIEKKFGKDIKIKSMQKKARLYAIKQINIQKNGFIRLGVLADWENSYNTMNFDNEANELRAFRKILKNGYIYRDFKPIYWCLNCQSTLAEAEIEYKLIKHTSIFVGFPFIEHKQINKIFKIKNNNIKNGYIIIWTTMPWTIISNQALGINYKSKYALLKCKKKKKKLLIIISKNLVKLCLKRFKMKGKILSVTKGKNLSFINFLHPLYKINNFYNRKSTIYPSNFINSKEGTGISHISPAYGNEDFILFKKFNINSKNLLKTINNKGYFKSNIPIFKNINIWKSTNLICNYLKITNNLFKISKIKHNYMHCWRHKTPIIYNIKPQWFINMDIIPKNSNESLRKMALKNINKINFYPSNNKLKLKNMLIQRPDWIISRQRQWGVPIALFLNKINNNIHPKTFYFLKIIAKKIEKFGIESWQDINNISDLKLNSKDSSKYKKITDTLDVWFDSGITHFTILNNKYYKNILSFPADLYLEGVDQHRGWFHTSLLTSIMLNKCPPYKSILTHGFVIDKDGKKFSKSKKNKISLKEIIKLYGAEILRLWVASSDYTNEISVSKESFNRIKEIYRRIRNTLRFLLSNLKDFNYNSNSILIHKLIKIDKYAIIYLHKLQKNILNLYKKYKFHFIISKIQIYFSEELGSFYFEIIKDRLYTNKINSFSRRSAQTVLWYITRVILSLISPILSFTSEEIWKYFVDKSTYIKSNKSIFTQKYYKLPYINNNYFLIKKIIILKNIRKKIFKEIEKKRIKKNIGSSLQIMVKIKIKKSKFNLLKSIGNELKFIFMVSSIKLIKTKKNEKIYIFLSKYKKCLRCWYYCKKTGFDFKFKNLCIRCIDNLYLNGEKRYFV